MSKILSKPICFTLICTLAVASAISAELFSPTTIKAASRTFIINEVLYDPEGSDFGHEWIELKNIASYPINLSLWSIETAGSYFTTRVNLPNFTVYPGELVLLGESHVPNVQIINTLSMQNGGVETDGIRLKNQNNEIIDTLLYDYPNTNELRDDRWEIPEFAAPDVSPGHSLARYSDIDTDDSSIDFVECENPTPGEENVFPPSAAISELASTFTNTPLTFDGSDSFDLDGHISSWEWTILKGEDVLHQSLQQSFTSTFTEEDDYTIILTVTDNDGQTDTTELTVTVTEDPENPTITAVSEARTFEKDKIVTIEAAISTPPGIPTDKEAYALDETGGIRLKVSSELELVYGKTYILSGKIDTVYGETRLSVSTVKPSEKTVSLAILQIPPDQITPEHLGSIISTEFVIDSKRDRYFYGKEQPDGTKITAYIPEYANIEIPEETKGTTLNITGIVSRYGTNPDGSAKIRIIARFADEVGFTETQAVLGVTGTSLIPTLVAIPSVAVAIVLRRVFS